MFDFEECGLEILRAVTEGVEEEHQDSERNKSSEVFKNIAAELALFVLRGVAFQPGGRFVRFGADVNHQKGL